MCGITGIISRSEISRSVIESMTLAVAHRGPDAQGIFLSDDQKVALGHRRLSVIDLSNAANQPMTVGNYTVVYNGEIYNFQQVRKQLESSGHTFSTGSDTEVILHAFKEWGADSFEKLKGMFAFALYDQEKRKVYLVRDRVGKKPLYVYRDESQLAFSSELKSLLSIPGVNKTINRQALAQFLHLGYVPGPLTAWLHIEKFPSGTFAEIAADLLMKETGFWSPQTALATIPERTSNVLSDFEQLLAEAVSSRLISDVPLGAFLSGGTDSSLVTAIASKMTSKKLNTFTIGFEDASFDESQYASKVSSILGTDHHMFILKERDALELVEPYMQHFDEPFADSSAIPFMLLSDHARKEVTVALTGDGGDELFLGYGAYTWASRVKKYGWTRSLLPELSIHKVRKTVSMFSKVGDEQVRSHVFSQEQGFFLMKEIEEMTGLSTNFVYRDPNVLQNRTEEEKQAFFDLNYYLKDDLLVKVDRASMKYALECRCPLLDSAVIDFALRLPHEFKIQNGTSKVLLKKLLSKYLPEELVYRKKWGFGIPLSKWLRGELRFLTEHYLDPGVLQRAGFADPAIVSELVRHFNNGDDWLYHRVWTLVCLHYWFVRNAD